MIISSLSWIYILVTALCTGNIILYISKKITKTELILPWDVTILTGIMGLAVYAQFFSLFYKVGAVANIILLGICAGYIFLKVGRTKQSFRNIRLSDYWNNRRSMLLVISLLIVVTVLVLTIQPSIHYDTDLYHAQAVRWIEEYGIIPGLGNLHNRFAYNSSFFSLQALFSFKFLLGQSLHTINGFITVFFLVYAVCSMKIIRSKKLGAGDFLKVGIIWYVIYFENCISSVTSDNLAMLLVLYITSKWLDLYSEDRKELEQYIFLGMLSVFAVTVKLSVVPIILILLIPIIEVLKEKKYKIFFYYFGVAVLVGMPFIIRNIIISGYLVYPYPTIDLFSFDWEMSKEIVIHDSQEIMVWGRGLRDVAKYDWPIWKWFPNWYRDSLSNGIKLLVAINIICIIYMIPKAISCIKKNRWELFLLYIMSIISFIMWIFTAPLVRYGMAYLIVIPCVSILYNFSFIKKMQKVLQIVVGAVAFLLIAKLAMISYSYGIPSYIIQKDYSSEYICTEVGKIGETTIYTPMDGDRSGYHYFPATPFLFKDVECRGTIIQDGIRRTR